MYVGVRECMCMCVSSVCVSSVCMFVSVCMSVWGCMSVRVCMSVCGGVCLCVLYTCVCMSVETCTFLVVLDGNSWRSSRL